MFESSEDRPNFHDHIVIFARCAFANKNHQRDLPQNKNSFVVSDLPKRFEDQIRARTRSAPSKGLIITHICS